MIDVLNGLRSATLDERLDSLFARVELKPYTHLLARESAEFSTRAAQLQVESRADQLALELIAPANEICQILKDSSSANSYYPCCYAASSLLRTQYHLPNTVIDSYAQRISRHLTGGPSTFSELGFQEA